LAKAADQIKTSDVTRWAVAAVAIWAVAILGGNIAGLLPESLFAGLHSSRLEGANVNQLRSQLTAVQADAARLEMENNVLVQRFRLNEQQSNDMTRRVGALELSIPKLLENVPYDAGIDRTNLTASAGPGEVTTFETDGGLVEVTHSPMPSSTPVANLMQPIPSPLTAPAANSSAFGIALGPPVAPERAGEAWQSLNSRIGILLLGLSPLIADAEGNNGKRMVAGPLATEQEAAQLCGRIAKVGVACATVSYVGEALPN
jgi:hypothetical protein